MIGVWETIPDSGAGPHHGGNGPDVAYRFLRNGTVAIHDDGCSLIRGCERERARGARHNMDRPRGRHAHRGELLPRCGSGLEEQIGEQSQGFPAAGLPVSFRRLRGGYRAAATG